MENLYEGDQDVSCYSNFMLVIMDKIVNAIHSTYRSIWVVEKDIFHTVIDNYEGNGTNQDVLEYIEYLLVNYNLLDCHQVPWYPQKQ